MANWPDLVRAGAERGVVRADIDTDTLFNVLVGTTFYGALVDGRDDTDHLVDELCALVMQGAQAREKE